MAESTFSAVLAVMTAVQRRRWRLYIRGMTLTEIACAEGVSVNAVKKSIKKGQIRAKKRLGGFKKGSNPPIG